MNLIRPVMQSALLRKNLYNIRYSRQYLRSLDVDQKQVEEIKAKNQQQIKKQTIFKQLLSANDRNANNHVKVRINHSLFNVSYYPKNQLTTCSIMEPQPILPRKTISASRNYIISSIKKCKTALHPIKRLYILDAINMLMNSHKKVAKLMVRTFWNLIDHAKQRGFDPMRLWVHGCIIGKTRRYFGVRYHAKGRGSKQKRDFCKVKVVLYEKQEDKFLDEIAEGHCAAGLANAIRRVLLEKQDTNYSAVANYSYITTAKGRQQASELLKRRIDLVMNENQKQGVFVPKKQVRKDILKDMREKVKTDLAALSKGYSDEEVLLKREKLFKKNMGISD